MRIHLNNPQAAPAVMRSIQALAASRPDIEISIGAKLQKSFFDWWKGGHIFLSLHRAEGFGLGLAEAMTSGYCAFGTGWSGNVDFMNQRNSICVPYELVPCLEEAYATSEGRPSFWAEPDLEYAASELRYLNQDRERLVAVAKNGQRDIRRFTDPAITAQCLNLSTAAAGRFEFR